jgi:hypothetical protein
MQLEIEGICLLLSGGTCMAVLLHIYNVWQYEVLSQVVNTSSAERCWSTYSFIHSVKRNRLNVNQAESLVYVHYNLQLLSHYCEEAKTNKDLRFGTKI